MHICIYPVYPPTPALAKAEAAPGTTGGVEPQPCPTPSKLPMWRLPAVNTFHTLPQAFGPCVNQATAFCLHSRVHEPVKAPHSACKLAV